MRLEIHYPTFFYVTLLSYPAQNPGLIVHGDKFNGRVAVASKVVLSGLMTDTAGTLLSSSILYANSPHMHRQATTSESLFTVKYHT